MPAQTSFIEAVDVMLDAPSNLQVPVYATIDRNSADPWPKWGWGIVAAATRRSTQRQLQTLRHSGRH
jgi:hypothetical protein